MSRRRRFDLCLCLIISLAQGPPQGIILAIMMIMNINNVYTVPPSTVPVPVFLQRGGVVVGVVVRVVVCGRGWGMSQ